MSCSVGGRHGSDRALLWLWCRLAAAAPMRPLAWELPYTVGAALKRKRKKKKKKKEKRKKEKRNSRKPSKLSWVGDGLSAVQGHEVDKGENILY